MSIHAHNVLNMIEDQSYTEEELLVAMSDRFGAEALYHTCSRDGMGAAQLIEFFKDKGKVTEENGIIIAAPHQKCEHGTH